MPAAPSPDGMGGSTGGWQQAMVAWLKQQVGKPYSKNGRFGPDKWDCSGLVVGAYKRMGVSGFGDVTYTQKDFGVGVGAGDLQIGDLIFANGDGGRDFGHVQIYIGGGRVIQAASTKLGVIESPLNTANIQGIRRIVNRQGAPIQGDSGHTAQGQMQAVPPDSGYNGGTDDVPALVDGAEDKGAYAGGMYANPDLAKRPTTDAEIKQYIKDNYGYMNAYMGDAELGPILMQAAREGISKDMLYGRLTGTKWWKTYSDTARKWQQIVSEDPATAAAQRKAKRAAMANQVGQLGLSISAQQLDQIVEQSLAGGWTPDQDADVLLGYANPGESGFTNGDLGATQQQIQTLMSQYMLVRSNGFKDVADLAKQVMSGEKTMDGIKANFANQAKSLFANNDQMIKLIDEGVSPMDALSNHRNAIANTLEIDPEQVDMVNNPQFRQVLDTVDGGKHRIMSISEAEQLARSQPGYKNTVGGRRAFTQAASFIGQYAGVN